MIIRDSDIIRSIRVRVLTSGELRACVRDVANISILVEGGVLCLLDSLNICVSVLRFMDAYCVLLTRVELRVALM